jgi:hypothetical protein
MPATKKTLRRRRAELRRRLNQSRRNINRSRRARNRARQEEFQASLPRPTLENILGITASQGYINVVGTGATLSKRSATNDLTQGMQAKLRMKDKDGNTRLHLATSEDEVRALVSAGVNINEKNHQGETPLHVYLRKTVIPATVTFNPDDVFFEVVKPYVKLILTYIKLGADLTIEDNQGIPIYALLWRPRFEVAVSVGAKSQVFRTLSEENYERIVAYLENEHTKIPEGDEEEIEIEIWNLNESLEMLDHMTGRVGHVPVNNQVINNALHQMEAMENF